MTTESGAASGAGKPTSEDVAKALRARIESGLLEEGSPLPTQMNLVAEFGVQRGVIRQALRRLQQEGLLTEVTRGAPPRIAPRSAARRRDVTVGETPQETLVALGPRIAEAFSAGAVQIDALCLTAESLSAALGEQRRLIREREVKPLSVAVRVLLPNRDIDLAFPRSVNGPEAHPDNGDLVHQRWLRQRNSHGSVLSDHLMGMRSSHGIDVDVQFRALPFTPPVKLYLLNRTEALFAYYKVTERHEKIDRTSVKMYDALGGESPLFSFVTGGPDRDTGFVAESGKWFNALWDTIATDLALG